MRPTETKTIGNHQVEMYTYATPRDIHSVRDVAGETKQAERLLEKLIVSIDGSKEKIVDTIMDAFSLAEYQELQELLANMIQPEKKTGSPSSTTATSE